LLQRCQRLDLQVLLGPNLGFLLVHSKRLRAGSPAVCSVPDVGTNVKWDYPLLNGSLVQLRGRFGRNQIAGSSLPILEVPHEQGKAYRRPA
jgi:hypothetical protein